jgi:phosphoglycerate dehydrogenase-like enzyme
MPTTILCLWAVPKRLLDHLQDALSGEALRWVVPEVNGVGPAEEATYLEHADTADILLGWRPSAELLRKAKRCKLLINPGAGVQHLAEPFAGIPAEERPVVVNGHGNAAFTAEHLLAMLLSLTRRLRLHDRWMREGRWRTGDKEAAALPLSQRRVGLLGYGHVNRALDTLLEPFGCRRFVLHRRPAEGSGHFGPNDLNAFLDAIDTLVLALPLTAETEGMIDARALDRLGPTGILINGARGKVVDEQALYEALVQHRIAMAGIDVWYEYQPEADDQGRKHPYRLPFHELGNVLLSPHRAASPFSDLGRWWDVIENIRRFQQGRNDFLNRVDVERGY